MWRSILFTLVLVAAIVLAQSGMFDTEVMRERLVALSGRWWTLPLLVVLQTVFYALALPGSAFLVIVPLFFSPAVSTATVAIGGGCGALAGYLFAGRLGVEWRQRIERRRTYKVLQRNSDFLNLCAMRILPGFPHVVINYGGGLLQLPRGRFVLAAVLGFSVKGYLYAVLVHRAAYAEDPEDLIRLENIWPLFVLAALLALGRLAKRHFDKDVRSEE